MNESEFVVHDEAGSGEAMLIGADSLARRLDISVRTLWRLRSSGRLPRPVKLGGSIRWRAAEISAWVAAGCPLAAEWEKRRRR